MPRYWLFKTEPSAFGFDDLERDRTTPWTGVRNFQARNNMLEMRTGDRGFFYHSSIAEPAIVGICEVVREAYPDFTAFERESEYYDRRSKPEKPLWQMVDVGFVKRFSEPITLRELRADPALEYMVLLRKGSRLSVQPVSEQEWEHIVSLRP